MRTCLNCQHRNFDANKVCEKCGYPLKVGAGRTVVAFRDEDTSQETFHVVSKKSFQNTGISVATTVFMVISSVSIVIGTLTMFGAWLACLLFDQAFGDMIYDGLTLDILTVMYLILAFLFLAASIVSIWMTVRYRRKRANFEPVGLAFKICTLLFVSMVAGILMLCDNDC